MQMRMSGKAPAPSTTDHHRKCGAWGVVRAQWGQVGCGGGKGDSFMDKGAMLDCYVTGIPIAEKRGGRVPMDGANNGAQSCWWSPKWTSWGGGMSCQAFSCHADDCHAYKTRERGTGEVDGVRGWVGVWMLLGSRCCLWIVQGLGWLMYFSLSLSLSLSSLSSFSSPPSYLS